MRLLAGRELTRIRVILSKFEEVQKMAVQWKKDVDAALTEARVAKMPLLLDFSAAPA